MVKFLKHQVKAIDSHKIAKYDQKVELVVVQQPVKARVSGRKETRNSSRRLVDPQPIVQLKLQDCGRNIIDYTLGIYFIRVSIECTGFKDMDTFMAKQRKSKTSSDPTDDVDILRGTTTVTAQFYKGSPYVACAVFDNLSVRFKGEYRLRFDLYEVQSFNDSGLGNGVSLRPKIVHWENATVYSSKFTVYTDASFDGLEASPILNEQLKKAGCRIRTRKPKSNVPIGMMGNTHFANGFKISKPMKAYPPGMVGAPGFQIFQQLFNLPMAQGADNGYVMAQAQAAQAAQAAANQVAFYNSPMPYSGNSYFDSPIPSRTATPIQTLASRRTVTDVFSRNATPVQRYAASGLSTPVPDVKSQYFTPSQNIPSTPQSQQVEIFSTPLTRTITQDNNNTMINNNSSSDVFDNAGLDLSPLEQDAVFHPASNQNSAYVLANYGLGDNNANSTKLDFNNLDNFYQTLTNEANNNNAGQSGDSKDDFAPRSRDVLFESFNDMINNKQTVDENGSFQLHYDSSETSNSEHHGADFEISKGAGDSIDFSFLLQDSINFGNSVTNDQSRIRSQQEHLQSQQPIFQNPFSIDDLDFSF